MLYKINNVAKKIWFSFGHFNLLKSLVPHYPKKKTLSNKATDENKTRLILVEAHVGF